ncbi:OLC1v1030645C1 [Oldenlandia corymbosa var. corymbosa]|uniref:RING-type E3 ubiquitin transferase n=1 Tax=Oldenlandia corymbosa var. corymbosa TaxID=529605 RepID=A0AAV1CJK3_OLDCO|nr:OLC1v1030645C1 [Oldenlandia corymbosa var. corymbosa]
MINPMNKLIAVAIDKDRSSQNALKWTVDNLLVRGQTILLVHVKTKHHGSPYSSSSSLALSRSSQVIDVTDENGGAEIDAETRELFLPFRVFCTRKDIHCQDVVLEDMDIVKALLEYVSRSGIEVLVLGAAAKGSIFRYKARDIPASVLKGVPDFCTVYIISKGKISSTRSASRAAPANHPIRQQILHQASNRSSASDALLTNSRNPLPPATRSSSDPHLHGTHNDPSSMKSPFSHRNGPNGKPYELPPPDTDISFVSSGRPSIDNMFPSFADSFQSSTTPPRLSGFSDMENQSYESYHFGRRSMDVTSSLELSSLSDSDSLSSLQAADDTEAEMKRLKLELKQTMEMYSTACKEALTAKQKALELHRWKMEEQQRLEEARLAEEAALALVEREKAKSRAALEHAEAAQRIAELEAQKRRNAELKALKELEEKNKVVNGPVKPEVRYRVYTIDEIEVATEYFNKSRKIGEGGYGPVYKCYLDHTPVAVKVLRPDAAHGRSQFQQEVEVLSCIRHPNMVLLMGACPEYGCLVYEYMSNGSLEDRLFRRGNTPALPWPHRFRIAAEIGTGLLFLHQTKPEPLVHRDLKPANILLDRNFVSKISDVGLARLVPPSLADSVTQYRMTSTAGTFCYIDPEYQQTGMLGVKSDVYSLGIIFLQLLTGKPPMGLTHHVERAIEKGTFTEVLDQNVKDWPVEEALSFAKLALKCAELRRKDRPDLGKVVLPELERLRALGEEKLSYLLLYHGGHSPVQSQVSQEELSYPPTGQNSYESSKSQPFQSS